MPKATAKNSKGHQRQEGEAEKRWRSKLTTKSPLTRTSPKGEKRRETPEAGKQGKTKRVQKRLKVSEKENAIQQNLANNSLWSNSEAVSVLLDFMKNLPPWMVVELSRSDRRGLSSPYSLNPLIPNP